MILPRRALLLGSLAACSRKTPPPTATTLAPEGYDLHDWSFAGNDAAGGSERVVVLVPRRMGVFPVLVALHGRGEAVRGAEAGAYGWVNDYLVGHALAALHRGRLTEGDLLRQVAPARLTELNEGLARAPFRGVILVCPHAPDVPGAGRDGATERYGAWIADRLLPRLRGAFPVGEGVGIDGVSMGGRMALRIGLGRPQQFAAVGSLQAAIRGEDAAGLVALAKAYREGRPGGKIRLVTSDGDYFREALGQAHQALTQAGVTHEFFEAVGPHNYQFNQGPGAIEMLLWHDRALRGAA